MPEATTLPSESSALQLLKAVKEVQERRVALWREYDDAFSIFLSPGNNGVDAVSSPEVALENGSSSIGRGCAADAQAASIAVSAPISEDLLTQILQITTQGLIECSHRLRSIQLELRHSSLPHLAILTDTIQTHENTLLRSIVQRDQLRRTASESAVDTSADIDRLQTEVQKTRATLVDLMQEVSAETADLLIEESQT